jgi:hypothetical protein
LTSEYSLVIMAETVKTKLDMEKVRNREWEPEQRETLIYVADDGGRGV